MPNFPKNTGFRMTSPLKDLTGKQKNIDKNKDGKISKADFDIMNSPMGMYGKKGTMANYGYHKKK